MELALDGEKDKILSRFFFSNPLSLFSSLFFFFFFFLPHPQLRGLDPALHDGRSRLFVIKPSVSEAMEA